MFEINSEDRGVVNICNPETNTVKEVVEEIKKYKKIDCINTNARAMDKHYQSVDRNLKTLDLDYIGIKEGIQMMFKYGI